MKNRNPIVRTTFHTTDLGKLLAYLQRKKEHTQLACIDSKRLLLKGNGETACGLRLYHLALRQVIAWTTRLDIRGGRISVYDAFHLYNLGLMQYAERFNNAQAVIDEEEKAIRSFIPADQKYNSLSDLLSAILSNPIIEDRYYFSGAAVRGSVMRLTLRSSRFDGIVRLIVSEAHRQLSFMPPGRKKRVKASYTKPEKIGIALARLTALENCNQNKGEPYER